MNTRLISMVRFLFAMSLLFWLAGPALGQHGGGGGHGGGGSAHFGGAGAGPHPSSGGVAHAGGAHIPVAQGANARGQNGGRAGFWVPSSGASGAAASRNRFVISPESSVQHFAGRNYVWQEPPSVRVGASLVSPVHSNELNNPLLRASGATILTMRPETQAPGRFPLCRFGCGIVGGPFLLNPWWGFGYYPGAYLGDYGVPSPDYYDQEPNYNPNYGAQIYEAPAEQGSNSGEMEEAPEVVLILRDGSSYAVTDYWLAGGRLHYITSYGGENDIDVNQLDLQKTVDENAKRGINFTLRPTPIVPPGDQSSPSLPNTQPPTKGDQSTGNSQPSTVEVEWPKP